jgi:hypothetical protein
MSIFMDLFASMRSSDTLKYRHQLKPSQRVGGLRLLHSFTAGITGNRRQRSKPMPTRRPGFGPQSEHWFFIIGGLLFMGWTGYLYLAGAPLSGLVIVGLIGIGSFWSGLTDLNTQQTAAQRGRTAPPLTRSDLTTLVMDGLGATPQDLQANQQGTLTSAQWARIQRDLPHKHRLANVSPLCCVEGAVKLRHGTTSSGSVGTATVAGINFQTLRPGFLQCFKRGARYRMYFVEISVDVSWSVVRYPILVAAEALHDA